MTYKIKSFMFEYDESRYYIAIEDMGVHIDIIPLEKVLTKLEFEKKCEQWYIEEILLG